MSGLKVLNLRRDDCSDAVRIDRATKWGNPFVIGRDGDRDDVCEKYAAWLPAQPQLDPRELQGRDLACWCAPARCHGDLLLRLANNPPPPPTPKEPA